MTQPPKLTTGSGIPVPDNQNSQTAGPRGPVLLQDFYLQEKLANFVRERIPERVVHAKGSGAFGTFTVTNDITHCSAAKIFSEIGKQTPMLARFSTVAGERGAADAERDVRGFALRFYTEDGNWDIVGNNTPVFFIRDGMKFPDFIHTQKRDPKTNMRNTTAMWDFWSLSPESLHQVTILFSDRGIPKALRYMHGYGSHTYSMINAKGERTWVKFHFRTEQGVKTMTNAEAARIIGEDRESSQGDLFETIEKGDFPKWRFYIQTMTDEQAEKFPYNPFDVTKVWSQKTFPLIEVGVFELNRNPENYFADIEQAAFAPSNIVPGVDFSPDKMLQARIFSYADAQRYRLGGNYQQLPVNTPHAPVNNYQRDGVMNATPNGGGAINYEPNSFDGPVEDKSVQRPPLPLSGDPADAYNHRDGNDDYTQAGDLFRLMDDARRAVLMDNIVEHMQGVPVEIQKRQIAHFSKADPAYGAGVAKRLGISL